MGYCCGLFVASLLAIHVIGTTLIAMSVYLSACKHTFPEIPITIPIGLAVIIWSTSVNMSNRLNKNGIRMLSILGVISLLSWLGITGFLMILAADNSVVPSISKEIAPDTLEKWNDEQILELIFEVGIILLGSGGLVLPHLPYLKNCMKEPKKFGKVFGASSFTSAVMYTTITWMGIWRYGTNLDILIVSNLARESSVVGDLVQLV
mmetsp:Transcript_43387/g.72098  ORF Transcript_43387/g.72098 Transcript_43387/m.72098 type:complete len:206 (+) Transcript_43387:1111-1728(+)